jgi:DNA-binding CsgD family transcriptional regulator
MYTSLAHRRLAQLALSHGDFARARSHARASMQLAGGMRRNALGLWPLLLAAMLAVKQEQYERAVRMVAALTAWRDRHGLTDDGTIWTKVLPKHEPDQVLRVATAALGSTVVDAAWAAGSALSVEDALADALAEVDRAASADTQSTAHWVTRRYRDDLTHREHEVAQLVGQGLSNRQIAERLIITEGTTKIHVGRILAKLGLHSRAQLAAWVARQGFVLVAPETPA